MLITGYKEWKGKNQRVIELGENLIISDSTDLPPKTNKLKENLLFNPIHMASQGYWQIQDEQQ